MKTSKGKIIGVALLILIAVGFLPATRDELHWRRTSSNDKAQNYARYLASWPNGRHVADAKLRFDERSWTDAQAVRSVEGYQLYQRANPNGTHLSEAHTRIEDLVWHQSTNTGSVWPSHNVLSLERYLSAYGTGRFAAEARTRIENLTWRQATNLNDIQSLESYLTNYGGGRFAVEARARIEDLTWNRATNWNTIRSLRDYAETYPQGRFLAEAQTRQKAWRVDERPFLAAIQNRTAFLFEKDLKEFLTEFPGHTKEKDAQQALKDMSEGRDIVDLVNEKKIEVETWGSGIQSMSVRVRSLVPYPFTIRIPVGTYFVSANQSAQNMVTTAESKQTLTSDQWVSLSPSVACANRPRDIPGGQDSFSVQRSPHQAELVKLMPVLDKARVGYETRQAAVWIVTDDADYGDLGILVASYTGFGGSRVIHETEAAHAMKICADAQIDITRKAIWKDRQQILRGVKDDDVKKWLEEKP